MFAAHTQRMPDALQRNDLERSTVRPSLQAAAAAPADHKMVRLLQLVLKVEFGSQTGSGRQMFTALQTQQGFDSDANTNLEHIPMEHTW